MSCGCTVFVVRIHGIYRVITRCMLCDYTVYVVRSHDICRTITRSMSCPPTYSIVHKVSHGCVLAIFIPTDDECANSALVAPTLRVLTGAIKAAHTVDTMMHSYMCVRYSLYTRVLFPPAVHRVRVSTLRL